MPDWGNEMYLTGTAEEIAAYDEESATRELERELEYERQYYAEIDADEADGFYQV